MEGIKNALTRKIGPLPVYAWGLMLVALIALFIVWRRSQGGTGAVAGGTGGAAPTDWTSVGLDPGLVPTQPATASVAPGGPASGLPVGAALSGGGGSFAAVRPTTTRLTPVIQAAKPTTGYTAAWSQYRRPPNTQPSGISQMWTGARQVAALQATQLSPLGAQANPHGRERS